MLSYTLMFWESNLDDRYPCAVFTSVICLWIHLNYYKRFSQSCIIINIIAFWFDLLQSLFFNLDKLVAPNRPCHCSLWWGLFQQSNQVIVAKIFFRNSKLFTLHNIYCQHAEVILFYKLVWLVHSERILVAGLFNQIHI